MNSISRIPSDHLSLASSTRQSNKPQWFTAWISELELNFETGFEFQNLGLNPIPVTHSSCGLGNIT